jgi:hypothetical protein
MTPATQPNSRDVLTWQSKAERNKLLRLWRQAVRIFFGEEARCLRIAWALGDLFNDKTGYAFPSNATLATETGIAENKVQAALLALEQGGAIIRRMIVHNGHPQRVIYPASTLIPRPAMGLGGTPTVGVGGDPQQPGVHILNKKPHIPKTEFERSRLAAEVRRKAQEHDQAEQDRVSGSKDTIH